MEKQSVYEEDYFSVPGGDCKRQSLCGGEREGFYSSITEVLLISGTAVGESGKKSENRNKEDMEHTELVSLWNVRKGLLPRDSDILNMQKQETKIIRHIENGKKERSMK